MGIQLGGVRASPRLEELASYGVSLTRGERGRQELLLRLLLADGARESEKLHRDSGQGTVLGFGGTEIVN